MKRIVSFILAIVFLAALSCPVFAAGITTVGVNEQWAESWTSSTKENMFLFQCTETGFYDVVFKDANQTAALWIDVEYKTEQEYDSPLYGRINFKAHDSDEYVVEQVRFTAGRIYEVSLIYHTILENDPDYNVIFNNNYIPGEGAYKNANISVTFKPSEKEIEALSAQENYYELNDGQKTWLEFTTADASDYLFKNNFDLYNDDFYGWLNLYEAATFEFVGSYRIYSYNTILCDLKENTKYYLSMHVEGNASRYSKLSVNVVDNPIVDLLDMDSPFCMNPWDPNDNDSMYIYYQVKYKDSRVEWLEVDEIRELGYNISSLYYCGEDPEHLINDAWNHSDGYLYPAGKQSFSVIFKEKEYFFHAQILAAYKWFDELDPTSPDSDCTIEYVNNEWQSYYWRVKTDVTGYYGIYSTGFSEHFDSYNVNVIDSNNRCVEWNDDNEFYLEAGEEYLINIRYLYEDGVYEDVEWIYSLVKAVGKGNLDGNEGVTDADAIYLLYHTFLPDMYPVNQDCDFNGDGAVTDKDAVYLLYHTFLPEMYPLS